MQKSLQQLDLFGFPADTAPVPRKKEKTVIETVAEETKTDTAVPAVPIPVIQETATEIKIAVKSSIEKKESGLKAAGKRGRKSFREMDHDVDLIDVPEESVLRQKLYYSISEVAGWFKVNTSLLRYWENEFDVLQPRKTRKGDRLFRVEDIKNLQLIYFLLRQRKFSIDGARNYLKNNKEEADRQLQLMDTLTKFKSFLLEMKANLQ